MLYSALHCLGSLDDRCHLTDFSSSGSSSQPCWIKWLEQLESTWDNFKLCQAASSLSIHFQPRIEFSWWISLLVISGRYLYISHPYWFIAQWMLCFKFGNECYCALIVPYLFKSTVSAYYCYFRWRLGLDYDNNMHKLWYKPSSWQTHSDIKVSKFIVI